MGLGTIMGWNGMVTGWDGMGMGWGWGWDGDGWGWDRAGSCLKGQRHIEGATPWVSGTHESESINTN